MKMVMSSRAVLLLIVAVAAILRLYGLANDPVGLNEDEALTGYDAYCLGLTLRDHHGHLLPLALQGYSDWASPLLTYIAIPFVRLFGLSTWPIRLPVALLGIASVPLLYVLVRKLFGRNDVALVAAGTLAISPWSVVTSREAIPPSILPFFTILFVLALVWAAEDGTPSATRNVRTAVAAAAGALLTYVYPTQKLFVPLMIIAAAIIYFRRRPASAGILVGVFVLLVAPIYVLAITHPETNLRFKEVGLDGSLLHRLGGFATRYFLYLSPLALFGSGDADLTYDVPAIGRNFAVLAPFFYLGVFFAALTTMGRLQASMRRSDAALLLAWLALFPVAGSMTESLMHLLRGLHGFPLVPIFSAAGFFWLTRAVASSTVATAVRVSVACLVLFAALDFPRTYFTKYPAASKPRFQYGLAELFAYVVPHQAQFRSIVLDADINQPYMYLLFYSRWDPHKLDYREVDGGEKAQVVRLGKFRFEPVTEQRIAKAPLIFRVDDGSRTWYSAYDVRGTLVVKQEVSIDDPKVPARR
jgi:4-amino-4-deoxy-L-arabinose transferase-like glycosyltransferase